MFEIEGQSIAVLRIFESTDPPHIVRGSGAVYLRSSKGKEPIDDHGTLLALARRGAEAESAARARLSQQPLIQQTLAPPELDPYTRSPDEQHVVVLVRAAPLTVTPQFADWPISARRGVHACFLAAEELLPTERGLAQVVPAARGAIARKSVPLHLMQGSRHALTVADSGGVIAASLRQPTEEGDWIESQHLRRDYVRPLLDAVVKMMATAEAYGRAVLDTWICVPGNVNVEGSRVRSTGAAREIHISGELTIPTDDDEIYALSLEWERELARTFGMTRWEGEE